MKMGPSILVVGGFLYTGYLGAFHMDKRNLGLYNLCSNFNAQNNNKSEYQAVAL